MSSFRVVSRCLCSWLTLVLVPCMRLSRSQSLTGEILGENLPGRDQQWFTVMKIFPDPALNWRSQTVHLSADPLTLNRCWELICDIISITMCTVRSNSIVCYYRHLGKRRKKKGGGGADVVKHAVIE